MGGDGREEEECDEEMGAICAEGAAGLLERDDKALIEWSKNRGARQPMEEVKRHLHTLKGGARMAGIMAMGDLSHELETLVISIDEGRIKASRAVDELLQHSVDELHRMRDTVIAGKPVAAANALLKRIQQAIAGFEVADEAQVEIAPTDKEVEKAVPAEFTIEPDDTVSMVIIDTPLADELAQIGRPAPDQDAAPQITERQQAAEPETDPAPEPEPVPASAPEPAPAAEPETAPVTAHRK